MRADRLVAILLMLQHHGQVTAAQVATELEISERTARRDLEALGSAGLPVYSTAGRGGGWRLLGGGRTDLSGFTAAEARSLFMIAGSTPVSTPELRSALRKLMRALPESFRTHAEEAATLLILEPAGWEARERPEPSHLPDLQAAVLGGEQLDLGYTDGHGHQTTRRVHPLGLVHKGRTWYLVAGTSSGLRTFRVDRVRSVTPTGESVDRPEGFDLAEAWAQVGDRVRAMRPRIVGEGVIHPDLVSVLRHQFPNHVEVGAVTADGWVPFRVEGWGVEEVAGNLGAFGAAARVHGSPAVLDRLRRLAAELAEIYGTGDLGDASANAVDQPS